MPFRIDLKERIKFYGKIIPQTGSFLHRHRGLDCATQPWPFKVQVRVENSIDPLSAPQPIPSSSSSSSRPSAAHVGDLPLCKGRFIVIVGRGDGILRCTCVLRIMRTIPSCTFGIPVVSIMIMPQPAAQHVACQRFRG